LEGSAKEDRITLAIRGDNIYASAFANYKDVWHVVSNRARFNLIRPHVRLRFSDDYRSLVGGYRNLVDLRLSKDSVLQAIRYFFLL
jgi:hypothetical protein